LQTDTGLIPYQILRSSQRRTVAIAVNSQAQMLVYAPHAFPAKDIQRFIAAKSDWVRRKVAEARQAQDGLAGRGYHEGAEFLFLGKTYPLRIVSSPAKRPSFGFDGNAWTVTVPQSTPPDSLALIAKKQFVVWYQEQAKEIFPSRIFNYSRIMQLDPEKIAVKTQKRSWGSCSYHRRSINLNWQLVMAPTEVMDYVVVHELAHLRHPNHSRSFWRLVEKFFPRYRLCRQWLNKNRLRLILP